MAPGTIAMTLAALRCLYNVTLQRHWLLEEVIPMPRIPNTLPVVLSPEEVLEFLECVPHIKHRTILTTCYAAGLRISEAVHLKPTNIDSQRMVIRVEQGKGLKDRYVMLSPRLLETLRNWWRTERPQQWLFPGKCIGKPITRHAVEKACQEAHKLCPISKPVTPHSFRPCICCPHAGKRDERPHDPIVVGAADSQYKRHGHFGTPIREGPNVTVFPLMSTRRLAKAQG